MPAVIPTGTSRAFALYVNEANVTAQVPAESVYITETGGESNAIMTFDLEGTSFNFANFGGLAQPVRLVDLTNSRTLFRGGLVNTRRYHNAGPHGGAHCTAISDDAWLDRKVLPKWTSKRPNNTNMSTDREQVQNLVSLIPAAPFDAINTYVASTNSSMPVVKVDQGGSVRDILSAIAESAATTADPTARRFYVDFDRHLHYFKGNESLTAPYRIGDARYTSVVKATSGIVSLVGFKESSGTPSDPYGAATVTLAGGYTQGVASLVPNEPGTRSITFNGTTGYASLAGATLHQADGPWSLELWFRRGATLGTAQTMVSAGATDYLVGFDTSNRLIVQKEGTGNNFVTDATYTDTSPHHLVVSRPAGGATVVYVDGVSKAGTTTARTFASAAGAVNIGRKLSTTDNFFTGTVQNVAFYSTALSAATALAHYNDGWTIVADFFEFETDINNAGRRVYVKGGKAAGSGWVFPTPANARYEQEFMIDRPQSTNSALLHAIGTGFLKREARETHGGKAVITMPASTWRVGQTLTIDDAGLGIDGSDSSIGQTYEIKQLDTVPNMGSGVCTYTIYFGALPWSGTFSVARKNRRGRSGGSTGSN